MRFVAILFAVAAILMGGLVVLLNSVDATPGVAVVAVCAFTVAVGIFSVYRRENFPEIPFSIRPRSRRPLAGAQRTRH